MADEWKFANTTWDSTSPTAVADLADKLHSFLTQTGWELTSWSPGGLGDDLPDATTNPRYYTRSDHGTRDIWHYTGDGILQKCGIKIQGNALAGRFDVMTFLENTEGDGEQADSNDTERGLIIIDTTKASATADVLMIGGEWGFFFEVGEGGSRASVAMGMIGTFIPWSFMNGTRDEERKWVTQGLTMDWVGPIRWTNSRNWRVSLNDGTDKNVTSSLEISCTRGSTDHLAGSAIVNNLRTSIGNFDMIFGGAWFMNSSVSQTWSEGSKFTFGLQSTPFDDRWRVSKILLAQRADDSDHNSVVNSSSTSDNLTGSSRSFWLDFRNVVREVPKLVSVGHLLTPWQNITETTEGIDYFVVQIDDSGRPFNVGIEWPGSANEITVA